MGDFCLNNIIHTLGLILSLSCINAISAPGPSRISIAHLLGYFFSGLARLAAISFGYPHLEASFKGTFVFMQVSSLPSNMA